ncbi:MAG: ATPase [Candidatus Accumulibacter sp.]|nr:ATPase [Accumulibacter sp.]
MSAEAQIHTDIEALRARISDTQELYREVCTVLFFRYGITPTANKLYQYVRKGSMSAPAEALMKFWEDLREKSRVRIEHPDLPDAVKSAAGDLVATLWTQAQAAAQEGFAVFRSEARVAVLEAQTTCTSIENDRKVALQELDFARQSAQAASERTLQLERDLAAERAGKEALAFQLADACRQQSSLEAALAEARHDFTAELEKLRQALLRSEERCDDSEKRALLEIDKERTVAVKLHKELAQARHNHQETEDRNRAEVTQLQHNLGELRQELGIAEGALQEIRATSQRQAEQLHLFSVALAERDTQKALMQRELVICQGNVASLTEELLPFRTVAPTIHGASKPKKRRKTGSD